MKPSIVFLGNAQAHTLYGNWVGRMPGAKEYNNHFVHYQTVSASDRSVIAAASVIVSQISDLEKFEFHELNPTAHIIRFPYVNGAFLWPYSGHTHPHWGCSLMHVCGAFAGESGDSFLGRLFLRKVLTSEAVKLYAELDIIKATKTTRRYELAMEMQKVRDEKADLGYDTVSYIDRNLSNKTLFLSRQGLAKPLFWYLARPVYSRLLTIFGECQTKLDEAERLDLTAFDSANEVPIHPDLVQYFNLPDRETNYPYRINHNRLTFDQYSANYMDEVYPIDIYIGIQKYKAGDYKAAVELLQRGLSTAPASSDGAAALSRAYAGLGRVSDALEMARVAVDRDPQNCDYLVNLADMYIRNGFHSAALTAVERSLEIHPHNLNAVQLLSELLVFYGQEKRAILSARGVCEQFPHVPLVHYRLANLLQQQGYLDEAAQISRDAVQIHQNDDGLRLQLSDILTRLGMFAEAVSVIRWWIIAYPDNAEWHSRLGHSLWRNEQFDEALESFEQAISLAPEMAGYKQSRENLLATKKCSARL